MAAPSIAPAKPSEAGLADVIACTSSICLVDGDNCRLLYRGYDRSGPGKLDTPLSGKSATSSAQ